MSMQDANNRFSDRAIITLALLLLWLPYVIISFPGNMAYDSGEGIKFFLAVDTSNPNNPYFQNVLMGCFYLIGSLAGNGAIGIFAYCLVQMLLEIALLADTLSLLLRRVHRKDLLVPLLLLYGIVPVFPLYAFSMAKDSSFALAVLLNISLYLKAFRAVDKGLPIGDALLARLSCSVLLIGLLRNHAWAVPLIAYVVFCIRHKIDKAIPVTTAAIVLLAVFALPRILGIPPTEIKESMSIPLQTTAYIYNEHESEMREDEIEAIGKVVPIDSLKKYDALNADPVKNDSTFTPETRREFIEFWIGLCAKYPKSAIEGLHNCWYIYYTPSALLTIKPHVFAGFEISETSKRLLKLENTNPLTAYIKSIDRLFLRIPIVGLLSRIGLYSWALGMMLVLVVAFRKWRYLYCFLPLFMVFVGCLLSPINGYFRYAFGMILSTPIALADLIITILGVKRQVVAPECHACGTAEEPMEERA